MCVCAYAHVPMSVCVQVLPRQTCGLFTHTVFVDDYKSGLPDLEENFQGGELFITILYSPVSSILVV